MATIAGISAVALVLTACGSSSTSTTSSRRPAQQCCSDKRSGGGSGARAPHRPARHRPPATGARRPRRLGDITGQVGHGLQHHRRARGCPVPGSVQSPSPSAPARPPTYDGSKEFEAQIGVRVNSGNPPDIGLVPAARSAVPAGQHDRRRQADDRRSSKSGSRPTTPRTGCEYGVVNDISVRHLRATPTSSRWSGTRPRTFAEKGYTVPTTWDELMALTDQIAATGAQAVVHRHQVR